MVKKNAGNNIPKRYIIEMHEVDFKVYWRD
jgi:hypothetical protein